MDAVQGGAPGWTPRFVDRKVGERVYKELLRFVTEMRDMPGHPARSAIDRFLGDFATDLQADTETRTRVERLKSDLVARPEVQDVIASAWGAVRAMIVSAAEDERSELRLRARTSLLSLGARLTTDAQLQRKVEGWLEDAAAYVVTTYRGDHLADHRHGGELGRRPHVPQDRGPHRSRPAVHPDQRHGGGRAGGPADPHGLARPGG